MHRVIVYDDALPQTTDVLTQAKASMVGLSFGMRAVLGGATAVHGLSCAPTSPASMQVTIGTGSIYQLNPVDQIPYGDLGTDAATIVKQGILYTALNLTLTAPTTSGFSQNYLVQAAQQDIDGGATVVSYYNSTPPNVPFAGPGGDGLSQFTLRQGQCVISLKAGAAATTGTQTTPSADPGFIGLYVITVANGAVSIVSGNISTLATAPFFTDLPSIPAGVQSSKWTYSADTGTANNLVATITPNLASYGAGGLKIQVKAAFANTGAVVINVNSLGNKPVIYSNGSALSGSDYAAGAVLDLEFDGTSFQLGGGIGGPTSTVSNIHYGVDTGSANAMVATFTPAITSLVAGMQLEVTPLHANTSTTVTLNANGLGAVNCFRSDGSALVIGDIQAAPGKSVFIYDQTTNKMMLVNPDLWVSQGSIPFPGLPANGLLASSIAGSSTTASMTISAGGCSNNLGTQSILSQSSINWSVTNGNNANGYQGGTTLPTSSTLVMYLIWGTAGVATFASLSINSPTLPSGYQYFRILFPFTTDSSGNPIVFTSYEGAGGSLICSYASVVVEPTVFPVPAANRTLVTVTVPMGFQLEWRGRGATAQLGGTPGENTIITSPGDPDVPATNTGTNSFGDMFASSGSSALAIWGKAVVITNTSGQVGARVSGIASVQTSLYLFTQGFTYNRRL